LHLEGFVERPARMRLLILMRYAHVELLRNVLEGLSILATPDAIPKASFE